MLNDSKIHSESFDYFFNRANVFFLVLTKTGRIVAANKYARTMTGRPLADEQIKDLIIDFKNSFDLAALVSGKDEEHLFNITGHSGLPQSLFFSFREVSDHILALGRLDVDELETMRREILTLNQELGAMTRELHQKNAKLKTMNAEKNKFMGMAAHDLRKPIGLIISYSEFLLDEAAKALNAEHRDFLDTINRSSEFMKQLVDDFLDVSAIEAGRFELNLQRASIRDAMDRSLELNDHQASKKGVELRVRFDEDLPLLHMDSSKIEQAITNLVSNAIEHSNPGSRVEITTSCNGESVQIVVRDHGPGLPADQQHKLFKPFEKTTVRKTGGEKSTGLGMVIIRKIVETHGGRIWVHSQEGEGTAIGFSLPLHVEVT